uniref:Uncharacterized protein n=1 Tax=Ditylenchus dipsaci TaxID=166011 RepID=A0A915DQZ8_9BILA
MFDFNDREICGFDVNKSQLVCELNRCGFPVTKLNGKSREQRHSQGDYTLTNANMFIFKRTIRLPEEADAAAVTFDLTDPMFLRFSCPISDRAHLKTYSKAKIGRATELKYSNFRLAEFCPNNGVYGTDTCGFPAANIVLDASNNGFVLKGSWVTAIGNAFFLLQWVVFRRLRAFFQEFKVDDGRKYSTFVKENEGSLLTVTGVEH